MIAMTPIETSATNRPPAPGAFGSGRAQLVEHGFLVLEGMLTAGEVATYRELAQRVLVPQASEEYRQKHRSIGSLFDILREPGFVELICAERVLAVLGALGFADPRFQHGIVFNKLPHTPPTFWHQDGTTWDHPVAYEDVPHDLILIYYLSGTNPENGCLRVIPGSHRRRHPLHDQLRGSYTPDLRRMQDSSSPAFQVYADEVSVPVHAGDLVLIDARLLHAAHANRSEVERTALSLWYLPSHADLPECIRARFTLDADFDARLPFVPACWPAAARERLRRLLPPPYSGTELPLSMNNIPGPGLR